MDRFEAAVSLYSGSGGCLFNRLGQYLKRFVMYEECGIETHVKFLLSKIQFEQEWCYGVRREL